jgi:hypothetical protein
MAKVLSSEILLLLDSIQKGGEEARRRNIRQLDISAEEEEGRHEELAITNKMDGQSKRAVHLNSGIAVGQSNWQIGLNGKK